jgi:CBS domain-containing protein
MQTCQEIMTPNPICCLAGEKAYVAAQRMQSYNVGALPVVENYDTKTLIGMVTDRDLAVRVVGASRDATTTTIGEIMSPNLITCHPENDLNETIAVMAKYQIRRIPVIDVQRQLVGIIAQADVAIRMNDSDQLKQMLGEISQPDQMNEQLATTSHNA